MHLPAARSGLSDHGADHPVEGGGVEPFGGHELVQRLAGVQGQVRTVIPGGGEVDAGLPQPGLSPSSTSSTCSVALTAARRNSSTSMNSSRRGSTGRPIRSFNDSSSLRSPAATSCSTAIRTGKWNPSENKYAAISRIDFARQLSEPVRFSVGLFWLYRNRLVKAVADETAEELALRVKHKVLSHEKALSKIQREVDAFENFERLEANHGADRLASSNTSRTAPAMDSSENRRRARRPLRLIP